MRSPASINLVLMAGGVTMFAAAANIQQHSQHAQHCKQMRDSGTPDVNNACTPHRGGGGAYGGHGGYGGHGWGSGYSEASVSRGGFGSTGAHFGGFGMHGFG
jgi:hypothetical protein